MSVFRLIGALVVMRINVNSAVSLLHKAAQGWVEQM